MLQRKIFYQLKPFIPRRYQLMLRSSIIRRKLESVSAVWPIDPKAGQKPKNWSGWPGGKRFAVVLTHDVEHARGQDKSYQVAHLEKSLGFRSSFNLVPQRYVVSSDLRHFLVRHGFEVGVHDYNHDGKLFGSQKVFEERAPLINNYLREWGACGFRAGAMHHNLDWIGMLDIEYDSSTFDTDPFEPQPDGVGTIFPFLVKRKGIKLPFVEMPYTLPQDFTLYVLLREKTIDIWKNKIDWIAEQGGMVLVNTHPDYMCFEGETCGYEQYGARIYEQFLEYLLCRYEGEYWSALPREAAKYYKNSMISDMGCGGQQARSLKTGRYA
ncbi:MAG: hypothetical protein LBI42_06825 [Chitinispirillales bacterium]|jgi:hypothetical protein|nr:hypothetical protein [Chitinispirillales bacterium]